MEFYYEKSFLNGVSIRVGRFSMMVRRVKMILKGGEGYYPYRLASPNLREIEIAPIHWPPWG